MVIAGCLWNAPPRLGDAVGNATLEAYDGYWVHFWKTFSLSSSSRLDGHKGVEKLIWRSIISNLLVPRGEVSTWLGQNSSFVIDGACETWVSLNSLPSCLLNPVRKFRSSLPSGHSVDVFSLSSIGLDEWWLECREKWIG